MILNLDLDMLDWDASWLSLGVLGPRKCNAELVLSMEGYGVTSVSAHLCCAQPP